MTASHTNTHHVPGQPGQTRQPGTCSPVRPVRPGCPVPPSAPPIILPHGGYKKLIAYRKSDTIYLGTVLFCRRFLPAHGDRTVDQMTQAARSCKQNIAEGSAASGTSRETEIKLTNVARATLDELMEDYLDWRKAHGSAEWPSDDPRRLAARDFARKHADWEDWRPIFETRPADTAANLMLTLCHQTRYLLDKMLASQEEDFRLHGGVRERMHAARTATRSSDWDKNLHSRLASATTPDELAARAREIKRAVDRSVESIRRRNGWG